MCDLRYVIILSKIIGLLVDNNTTLEYRFKINELYFIIYMYIIHNMCINFCINKNHDILNTV